MTTPTALPKASKMERLSVRLLAELGRIAFIARHRVRVGPLAQLFDRLAATCDAAVLKSAVQLPPSEPPSGEPLLEIHSLLCTRDVRMFIWALRSFHCAISIPYRVAIHDDGSLGPEEVALLETHFPGIRIIRRAAANAAMEESLKDFPGLQDYRRKTIWALKLLDFNAYAEAPYILTFDADILFFDRAKEIEDFVTSGTQRVQYVNDGHDYSKRPVLRETFGNVLNGFNAGFILYPRGFFPLAEMNEIAGWILGNQGQVDRVDDQLVYSVMSARREHSEFSKRYTAEGPDHPKRQDLACKHYHSSAKLFFTIEGLLHAFRKGNALWG